MGQFGILLLSVPKGRELEKIEALKRNPLIGALDHVVSVAAIDYYDQHPDVSGYNDRVDIATPGVSVWGVCSPSTRCLAKQ